MNNGLDQMYLTDIYRTFHPTAAEYPFFSSTYGTFSRIDHARSKTSFSKFKNIEIIPNIFSDHSGMKLEINNRSKIGKLTNMWKLNNILLSNQWVKDEIKMEIEKS